MTSRVSLFFILMLSSSLSAVEWLKESLKVAKPAYVFFAQGSGVLISKDGLILTNEHVLIPPKKIYSIRTGDGSFFQAKVIGTDPLGDLALLKILKPKKKMPFVKFADYNKIEVGEPCFALGNPFASGSSDLQVTCTAGVVSGIEQSFGRYTDALLTDTSINPGNSGGPLLNQNAELIGINGMINPKVGIRSNTGLAYAISIRQIKKWLPKLRIAAGGEVYHPDLEEIRARGLENSTNYTGIQVLALGSYKDQNTLKVGDIVLRVNGIGVRNIKHFYSMLFAYPGDSLIHLKVRRKHEILNIVLKLKEQKPASMGFKASFSYQNPQHLIILDIDPEGPGAAAGLKNGDEILAIGSAKFEGEIAFQYLRFTQMRLSVRKGMFIPIKIRRKTETGYKNLKVLLKVANE
ncbi:MAG: trypsin-like peptidase domain-containing protein [Lentisphaeria bacterium]|nr:trypsin-like peptidase domain-containing protein [Lentisphaeria bacterium]